MAKYYPEKLEKIKITEEFKELLFKVDLNTDLLSSPYYPYLVDKYRSDKIKQLILSNFATVISSNFKIIDFSNQQIHGKKIETIPAIVMEELILMTLLY